MFLKLIRFCYAYFVSVNKVKPSNVLNIKRRLIGRELQANVKTEKKKNYGSSFAEVDNCVNI